MNITSIHYGSRVVGLISVLRTTRFPLSSSRVIGINQNYSLHHNMFESILINSNQSTHNYHTSLNHYLGTDGASMKRYMAKKKTSVETLISANKITDALKLFYESSLPKRRDAECLILSESLSFEECLAVYNHIKQSCGIDEKIIVAILSVGKDKKYSERDKILDDAYDYLMLLPLGEKNSMNAFKWNTIISQFCAEASIYNTQRALNLLSRCDEFGTTPSKYVIGNLLLACTNNEMYKSVIDIFSKLEKFHIKPDIIHFHFYIKALAKMKYVSIALDTVKKMESLNLKPDGFIYSNLILMCAELKQVDIGKQLHKAVKEKDLSNIYLDTSLIHMYCGFGMLEEASALFYNLKKKDLAAWNAIIYGHGTNNQPKRSLELFQEMQKLKVTPDNQTFVCLLDACSVGGLLVEGFQMFRSMEKEYHITPDIRHYGCMIKLLLHENEYSLCLQLLKEMKSKKIEADQTIQKLVLKKMQDDPEAEELLEFMDSENVQQA